MLGPKLQLLQFYKKLIFFLQALVGRNDVIWGKEHVTALHNICPMVSSAVIGKASAAEFEGYGASKLTVDSAVKYLQLACILYSLFFIGWI